MLSFINKIYALDFNKKNIYLVYECDTGTIFKTKLIDNLLYVITDKHLDIVKHITEYKYVFNSNEH